MYFFQPFMRWMKGIFNKKITNVDKATQTTCSIPPIDMITSETQTMEDDDLEVVPLSSDSERSRGYFSTLFGN